MIFFEKNMFTKKQSILFPLFCNWLLPFLLLLTGVSSAAASIAVDRSIIYLTANQLPRQDVLVYNYGQQKAYVETAVFEVIDPGTPEEKLQKTTNLADLKLLVSPQKMTISPDSHKRVRFSYLGDHARERVFRINITPIIGKVISKTTAVKLVVAYQILLIVTPDNAQADIVCKRQKGHLLFTNNGNTNVLMTKARICQTRDTPSDECKEAQVSKRLYAKNTWLIPMADEGSFIEFEVKDGSQSSRDTRRFPAQ